MNALIIVDLQNDFVEGGALAVSGGAGLVPILNRLQARFDLVVATQDWHPADHGSFAANQPGHAPGEMIDLHGLPQVLWAVHCVRGTAGADFVPGLDRERWAAVFVKGTNPEIDSYSGFFDNGHRQATGLGEFLQKAGVTEVYVAGLATDYCVKFTALDARRLGFATWLIEDASRGVELAPGDVQKAVEEMRTAGVQIVQSASLLAPKPGEIRTGSPTLRERMLGALWSALAGDALGVPVEFLSRPAVRQDPVRGMRGFGTHRQPAGTWSDDSSLLLCTAESLVEKGGYDAADLAQRFIAWERVGVWTPHGEVFDIGIATSQAISKLKAGVPPETAGGADENSNGNGSLMRILPMALWYHDRPAAELADVVQRASALTHRHPRAQMACVFYCLTVQALLGGAKPSVAYDAARTTFAGLYGAPPFLAERAHFAKLEKGRLRLLADEDIESSGYVMHTLAASLWCLLTGLSLEDTVLKAVNLGGDTDTTGTVAGGLAGAGYGLHTLPTHWCTTLARHDEIAELFERFVDAIPAVKAADGGSPQTTS